MIVKIIMGVMIVASLLVIGVVVRLLVKDKNKRR